MAKLEELGKVIKTDVLIIGGGCAGLSAAISTKEENPDLDVIIVDRNTCGYAGLAGKSGHGFFEMTPGEDDPEEFVKYQTEKIGQYLVDQDFLRQNAFAIHSCIKRTESWGVKFAHNPDGTYQHLTGPNGACSIVALPLDINITLYQKACEMGVKFFNRVYVTDFLKDGDKISGALGFALDDLQCFIFGATSFVLATHSCQFNVQSMFNGTGAGIAMAYRAGAEMRNAEFGVANDTVYKNDGHPIYGSFNSVFNAEGTNISDIYAPDFAEVSLDLQLGAEKEMEEGRGPIYVDFNYEAGAMRSIGFRETEDDEPGCVFGQRRIWPPALEWQQHVLDKAEKYRNIDEIDMSKPLCSYKMAPETSPLRVDMNMKTSLPNLWAAGAVCYTGSSTFEWIRGNGVAMCLKHGMRASIQVSEYADVMRPARIDPEEVQKYKDKFMAPLKNEGGLDLEDVMDRIAVPMTDSRYILRKTEESMTEALAMIEDIRKDLPKMYAYDGHTLAKCHDWEAILLIAEMHFKAGRMRKESRVRPWRALRVDYPEMDNKNWLKWIILQEQDGEMKMWTEDIPIQKYKYKPSDL